MGKDKKVNERVSITFSERVQVISTSSREDYYWYYFVSIIMMLLGTVVPVLCFASSFELVYRNDVIVLAGACCALLSWAMFRLRAYMKFSVPVLLALLGYIGFYYQTYFENGFYYLENAVIAKINEYLELSIPRFIAERNEETCVTVLLLVPLLLVSLSLSLIVAGGIRKNIYLILTIPLVFSGFVVGEVPNALPFCIYIIELYMLFGMMSSPFGSKKKSKNASLPEYREILRMKMAAMMGIVLCVLGIFLAVLFPAKDYDKYVDVSETKRDIQMKLYSFSFDEVTDKLRDVFDGVKKTGKTSGYLQGGLAGGELQTTRKVEFTNTTSLKITTLKAAGGLYLKGFAGSYYSGKSWEGLSKQEEKEYRDIVQRFGSGIYTGENLSNSYLDLILQGAIGLTADDVSMNKPYIAQFNLDIDYINANEEFLYAPYFLGMNSVEQYGLSSRGDLFLKPNKHRSSYTYSFYRIFDEHDLLEMLINIMDFDKEMVIRDPDAYENFASFERAYRNFVHRAYVGIPEGKFTGIEQRKLGIAKAENTEEMIRVVEYIRNYLSENMTYSLEPGALPKGKDYIENFLFESKKGYCAHFASAAVMLLRYYGVPARYVEGYILTEQDINNGSIGGYGAYTAYDFEQNHKNVTSNYVTVEIRDSNAHAWVEVYLDGVGWFPVEMTAGYTEDGITDINSSIEEQLQNKESTTPLPTNTPKPTSTPVPTEAAQPTRVPENITPTGVTENERTPESETAKIPQEMQKESSFIIFMLRFIILILLLFLLLYMRYHILYFIQKRGIRNENQNHAAIYLYQQISREFYLLGFKKMESESYENFFERVAEEYPGMPEGYLEILMLIMKAKFSNEGITKSEKEKVTKFYEELRSSLYKDLKPIKRFYVKYVKVI